MPQHPDRIIAGIILKATDTVDAKEVKGLHLVNDYAEAAGILHGLGAITKAEALAVMKAAEADGLAITADRMEALLQ